MREETRLLELCGHECKGRKGNRSAQDGQSYSEEFPKKIRGRVDVTPLQPIMDGVRRGRVDDESDVQTSSESAQNFACDTGPHYGVWRTSWAKLALHF